MSVIQNTLLLSGDDAYNISRSLRFRSSASACLTRTYGSTGNAQKFTGSVWVKRGTLSSTQTIFGAQNTGAATWDYFGFNSSNQLQLFIDPGGTPYNVITNAVFRDPSAWYHVVFSVDTTQATAANRVRIYVNGVEQSLGTNTIPQNYNLRFNVSSNTAGIGTQVNYVLPTGTTTVFDGYLAELNWVDGTQIAPSSFGETDAATGVWKPKKYSGTYGTNGFYLNFSDNSSNTSTTIGKDSSGNGNNWTPNNISVTSGATYDSMTDVPTQAEISGNGNSNYCTLNPLASRSAGIMENGNLTWKKGDSAGDNYCCASSISIPSSGKWYWEVTVTDGSSGANSIGVIPSTSTTQQTANTIPGDFGITTNAFTYYSDGTKRTAGSSAAYGNSFTSGDIIGVAVDTTNGKIWWSKNGTFQASGDPAAGTNAAFTTLSGSYYAASSVRYNNNQHDYNFGQRPFAYTPPTGFKALNTFNLPTPTIGATSSTLANKYFDALTYTGNATYPRTISSLNFSPDLIWTKVRSQAYRHMLADSVRGTARSLTSSNTNAESVNDAYGWVSSFDSNGWKIQSGSISGENFNQNNETYVAWTWDAGASTVTNNSGSISSQVRANTVSGFSIVTYAGNGSGGATVGHGLGVAPKMVIVKRRDSGVGDTNWYVYNANLNNGVNPAQYYTFLNLTNAQGGASSVWNDTAPTSSVFSLGTSSETNGSGGTFVAYCFAAVAGYSAFGSYTGNGSTDGPFVFTGFRPRFILLKRSDSTGNWFIWDTARDTYNTVLRELYPDSSSAEYTRSGSGDSFDILSNGFKIRFSSTYSDRNANGGTYIYMAFAENPFKYSLAR